MPKGKKEKNIVVPKTPYVTVTRDLPWHEPTVTLRCGEVKNENTVFGFFSFESFEITDGGSFVKNNPCIVFYNCVLLQDMPYYNKQKDDAKKGTKMRKIEWREHFAFSMYEEGNMFGNGNVSSDLTLDGVKYSGIYGYNSIGYVGGDVQVTRNMWIMPLKITEENKLVEGGSTGKHTLIVHFPSFEFEIFGKKFIPEFNFRKEK